MSPTRTRRWNAPPALPAPSIAGGRRRRIATRLLSGMLVVVSLGLAACSGGDGPPKERPLTADEAATLAEVLYRNYDTGGADFRLAGRAGPKGGTVILRGVVDWKKQQGSAQIAGGEGRAPVTAVTWTRTTVLERRPGLDALLAGRVGAPEGPGATGAAPVLARTPDTNRRRLDQLIAIVVSLATRTPENTQLLLQKTGTAFLRHDELRGRKVSVLRYGTRIIYWLDAETGRMVRLEATDASGVYPVVVDLLAVGKRSVVLPRADSVIAVREIADLYEAVAPSSP